MLSCLGKDKGRRNLDEETQSQQVEQEPPKGVWEATRNNKQAFWCIYSPPEHYGTSLPAPSSWGNDFTTERKGSKEVLAGTDASRPKLAKDDVSSTDAPPLGKGAHVFRMHELLGHCEKTNKRRTWETRQEKDREMGWPSDAHPMD